jgi:pimeloyl-ACP methyl ester carboxylesterase
LPAALASALAAHARAIFVEQVLGVPEAELDDARRARLAALLAAPTACRAGAEPAASLAGPPSRTEAPFPLVLHHSGANSSFEDDAAWCAWLASHGYVVVASAFLAADGDDLGIDARGGSAGDARFLARWARAQGLGGGKLGLVGHSAGAQAWLRFAAEAESSADALVLLDSTPCRRHR